MNTRLHTVRAAALAAAFALLAGCAAVTRFEAPTPGASLALNGQAAEPLPRQEKLPSKATRQHVFKASSASGETLYGILPLRVSGGKMAASIVLFAPALFIGGFRDVFPYYEIDAAAGVVRYKTAEHEEWRVYTPTQAERDRARQVFENAPAG